MDAVYSLRRFPTHLSLLVLLLASLPLRAANKWQTPTPEELSMTSQSQVPGAAAVYLFREEISDDNMSMYSVYVRLKVLTERGKDYADVELAYGQDMTVTDIAGRTIQPDGSSVEFSGKPYIKNIVRNKATTVQAKVFTLPAVQVGSILEYRYTWRYSDRRLLSPTWYVQQDLFMRKGHFLWKPFQSHGFQFVTGPDGNVEDRIAWAWNLPPGQEVQVKKMRLPAPGGGGGLVDLTNYELDVSDIMPLVQEENAPPMHSISQRVAFYYTGAKNSGEFWKAAGKNWSKQSNSFMDPGKLVKAEVARVITPSDPPDVKLRKIYADVMTLENTDFTRERDKREEKVVKGVDDVLSEKGGSGSNLTLLFVSMARVAGFKANAAIVANRARRFLWPALLQFGQLDDYIAIVQVDGKDTFFDPAERYCPYGMLAWQHSGSQGVRQSESGSDFVNTPMMAYTKSQVQRVGDLTMQADGSVTGTLKYTWLGLPGLSWRQRFLRTDLTELQRSLKVEIEEQLPKGLKIEQTSLAGVEDYEQPLVATYKVEGQVGEATATRLIVPSQLFETNAVQRFSAPDRTLPVDMHYGVRHLDAVRISLSAGMHWEAQPKPQSAVLKQQAQYKTFSEQAGDSLTFRRVLDISEILYPVAEYGDLHDFFAKVASGDGEQGVISISKPVPPQGQHGN